MPLYEVVLEQRYFDQQVINRWNYVGSGTPAAVTGSFALLTAMGALATTTSLADGTVMGEIQDLQSSAVTFVQCTARAVFIDEDFYGNAFLAGTVGQNPANGEPQSPVLAYGFRSSRVKQSIGRGYKRFVGVNEDNTLGGGVMSAAAIALMETVRVAMSASLTYDDEGNTLTFVPAIAQKEKYTTPSGREAYRYYATETLQAAHLATGITWELYDRARTQNSRQYGRGS